jgi:hypothetical protein
MGNIEVQSVAKFIHSYLSRVAVNVLDQPQDFPLRR